MGGAYTRIACYLSGEKDTEHVKIWLKIRKKFKSDADAIRAMISLYSTYQVGVDMSKYKPPKQEPPQKENSKQTSDKDKGEGITEKLERTFNKGE